MTPRNIIVRMPNWLGDVAMAIPFLNALRDRFPDATVDTIMNPGLAAFPLPAFSPGATVVFDRSKISPGAFGKFLSDRNYDRFYVLPPSFSSAWMAFRSGTPERIGFRGEGRGFFLNPAMTLPWKPRTQHLAREFLYLIDPALPLESYVSTLSLDEAWLKRHWPNTLPWDASFLAVALGARFGPAKRWPPEYGKQVVRERAAAGDTVVMIGTASDNFFGPGEELPKGVVDLCGKTTLPQMVAVLARARAVLSNDSGAMHVAAALGRPQIAIFGSTSPTWTGPLNPRAKILYASLDCSPCFERECPLGHTNCLKEVTPDLVSAALRTLPLDQPI